MSVISERGRVAVVGWQRTVDATWQRLPTRSGAVTPTLADAEDAFFGPVPSGARRQIIQTDATVPGGRDGIILNRLYIADKLAAFNQLYGDGRGPSLDPKASSRVDLAWDTRNGKVSVTVHPSTVTETSLFNEQSPYTRPRQVDPWPLNVGPNSLGTNFKNNFVVDTAPGRVNVKYDLINSGLPDLTRIGAVQGQAGLSVSGNEITGSMRGEDYPDREVVLYRADGSRALFDRPMGAGGSTEVFGTDYDTPRGQWRAPR